MDGIHIIVTCSPHYNLDMINSHAQNDCEATGYALIDQDFSRCNNVLLQHLYSFRTLYVMDGRSSSSRAITHITEVRLQIQGHQADIPMFLTRLGQIPIALGIP